MFIQGRTDGVHAFQNGMMKVFTNLVYEKALIWTDDIFAFEQTFDDYIVTVKQLLERLLMNIVKLNPTKTDICAREITAWSELSEFGVSISFLLA